MKKIVLFLSMAMSLIACSEKAKTTSQTGEDYDNQIQATVVQMQQSLFAVQKGLQDSTGGDSVMKKYKSVIDSLCKTIKEMPAFNQNTTYRDAAVKLGEFYKKSVGTYYTDIARIYKEVKDTSAGTKINAIIVKIREEEAKADDSFVKERLAFAAKNAIRLDDTDSALIGPADTVIKIIK